MHLNFNINSYRHKFVYVSDLLNKKKSVDYLAMSETRLDDSFPKSQFMIEGYSLYRQDVTSSSGGLIVYVRDDLPHRRMAHVEINWGGFESLCLEITIGKSKPSSLVYINTRKLRMKYSLSTYLVSQIYYEDPMMTLCILGTWIVARLNLTLSKIYVSNIISQIWLKSPPVPKDPRHPCWMSF